MAEASEFNYKKYSIYGVFNKAFRDTHDATHKSEDRKEEE